MSEEPEREPSRLRRRMLRVFVALLIAYLLAVFAAGMNPSTPFDWVINRWPVPRHEGLRSDPSQRTLVVLQHGLWRSAESLGRLERALEVHGYEVLNFSYPSTEATIQEHAVRLERRLEEHLSQGAPPDRIAFVGHSMGGLVIRSYLERPSARAAWTCLFIATPQRGARLAERRAELWLFDLLMGRRAARQLIPGDAIYGELGPVPCERIGVIAGARGDGEGWNGDVPGDDDGTVALSEALLTEATDTVVLELGHTRISLADPCIRQVLHFLARGRFAGD